jgi:hypothetical protein
LASACGKAGTGAAFIKGAGLRSANARREASVSEGRA